MGFPTISNINDLKSVIGDKKEIRFFDQPNGTTVCCYLFSDSQTFDSPAACECRGIAFDRQGNVVSRPLHKFFNAGEKGSLSLDNLLVRDDVAGVYEKIDGCMVATAFIDGQMVLRSKKSFDSNVVSLATQLINQPDNSHIKAFAETIASSNQTAIFELTHPKARVIVEPGEPKLELLHVRDNRTGEYLLLNERSGVHSLIDHHRVPTVRGFAGFGLREILDTLEDMKDQEGYVVQFANGDMVKIKCPWYLQMHRNISCLRERDIARLALAEELDDTKGMLSELGIDLAVVEQVESRLKSILANLLDDIEAIYNDGRLLDRKSFAIANRSHPLFSLAMERYLGEEPNLTDWYTRNRLNEDFSLRILANETLADEIEG